MIPTTTENFTFTFYCIYVPYKYTLINMLFTLSKISTVKSFAGEYRAACGFPEGRLDVCERVRLDIQGV